MTNSRVGQRVHVHERLRPFDSRGKAAFAGALAVFCLLTFGPTFAIAGPITGDLHGVTHNSQGTPVPGVKVLVHRADDNSELTVVSDDEGVYRVKNLSPGHYLISANQSTFAPLSPSSITIRVGEDASVDLTLTPIAASQSAASEPPLTDREKLLLDRLDKLEQRLAAMESKNSVSASTVATPVRSAAAAAPVPAAPAAASVRASTANASVPAALPPPSSVTASATPRAAGRQDTTSTRHVLLASLEDSIGIKAAAKPLEPEAPSAQAPAPAPAAAQHVLPEALEEPDPAAPNTEDVTDWADFTWMNGNTRSKTTVLDTKFFTPEVRFDTNYMQSFNEPKDHTMGGATESFRSGEVQIEQASVGGNFHWNNVRGRILFMDGLFATTTPRNDASAGVGQWDVRGAYKYVSEAWGGYHFNILGPRGVNVDAGIFVSYIGLFSYYNFDNWTYQPSYVSSNTPWFFNGLRIQMFPTKKLKIEPWIINGWQSYNKYNSHMGLGGQILYRPKEWLSFVFNQYGYGEDNLGVPLVQRIHTDDSVELRYYNKPHAKYIDKAAMSLTGDVGCQYGPGFQCTRGPNKDSFAGWMMYQRIWWGHDHYGLTYGGGEMNNPGRYLTLLPPINGADAISGSPYFTENPGQRAKMWDTTLTFQWMPTEYVTWWAELGYRHSDIPYFTGRQGITPPGGNTGSPQDYVCAGGGSAGTADLPTAEAFCGGGISSVWFPDLRKTQGAASVGVMVKF